MSTKKKIVIAICFTIFLALVVYITFYFTSQSQRGDIYEEIQQSQSEATPQPTSEPSDEPKPSDEPVPTEEPDVIPINFEELKEINDHVYAWIEIPNTPVAYPILRHPTDDAYYLDYTIERAYGLPGSIYTESHDAMDFTDFNTVIYGHDMLNDTMFGSLNEYRDETYFNEHRDIIIYTETEKLTYKVFAAVVYSDLYIPYYYNDANIEDRQSFLDSLPAKNLNSRVVDDVEVTPESNIITLSTCIGNMPNNRYLILAVQIDE